LGLKVIEEARINVFYDEKIIGEHFTDLLVVDVVIVALKATRRSLEEQEGQLLNYLKATKFEVGLLLNLG
jgi:GxxExxY protein